MYEIATMFVQDMRTCRPVALYGGGCEETQEVSANIYTKFADISHDI